ncbi:MAG: hypothetical protein ACETWC_08740 [Acidobacteriota bacterium]
MERTPLQLGYFMNAPVLGIGVKSYIAGTNLIIRHLQIRELAVESQRVVVLDWQDYPADGIIGYDIIHKEVTTVDYDKRQITFTRAEL